MSLSVLANCTKLAIIRVDELQYVEEDQRAALITAIHRAAQRKLPVVLVGAGLPQLRGRMGKAKSYAERLFDSPEIGPLLPDAARYAIEKPANDPGPHRSGDVAQELGRDVTALGPVRNKLIAKGMIWSPQHGDTAFTVPLFDEFMHRVMPGDEWRTA